MPVRSLNSSVLKWTSKEEVEKTLKDWSIKVKEKHPEIKKIGYFGSYARGNWGVGSDLDVIIVVERSEEPFLKRGLKFDVTDFPVPTEVLVYTEEELKKLEKTRFGEEVIKKQVIWIYP